MAFARLWVSGLSRNWGSGSLYSSTVENKTGEISSQWCRGSWASNGETFLGGGGHCTSIDADGEYLWLWFQPTGPDENRWGVIGGSGKWEGATGAGASKTVSQSPDGRSWVATTKGKIKRR
ncbi:MAG: hypothetical protein ACR2PZ_01255 [Pseudomonadales bacterium]